MINDISKAAKTVFVLRLEIVIECGGRDETQASERRGGR
jgi:hypothetical protein